jgi:hypothetical protein
MEESLGLHFVDILWEKRQCYGEKVAKLSQPIFTAQIMQKSYANSKRLNVEFQVGEGS